MAKRSTQSLCGSLSSKHSADFALQSVKSNTHWRKVTKQQSLKEEVTILWKNVQTFVAETFLYFLTMLLFTPNLPHTRCTFFSDTYKSLGRFSSREALNPTVCTA